jgi:hypothetical protein
MTFRPSPCLCRATERAPIRRPKAIPLGRVAVVAFLFGVVVGVAVAVLL